MTSRPVVGAQPPGQRNASAGLQRPPAPQGRPPAPIQDISTARSAGSIIDLTADADMKTAVGSGWLQQSAADLTGPSSNPPSTSARPTLPNLVLNDGSIITYDPDTFMAMDGKQSTVSSPRPSVPSLSYPPRPPPRAPERSLPTGDVKQKPERKPEKIGSGYALEKPEGASRYPDTREFLSPFVSVSALAGSPPSLCSARPKILPPHLLTCSHRTDRLLPLGWPGYGRQPFCSSCRKGFC